MRILSIRELAKTVIKLREEKGYTQEKLGNLIGISGIIIDKIEREDLLPSIVQLEELAEVLEFDIAEMFICKEENNSLHTFKSGALNKVEEKGIEQLFKMMCSLRQQIMLRRKCKLAERIPYEEDWTSKNYLLIQNKGDREVTKIGM